MKRLSLLFIFLISISSLSAFPQKALSGEFNTHNPLSMSYAGDFLSKTELELGFLSGSAIQRSFQDVNLMLSLASNFFGVAIDFDYSLFTDSRTAVQYEHDFEARFLASWAQNDFSVGALWRLDGVRARELGGGGASFFKLLECMITQHNDNYITQNNSSLSLFAGYYDNSNLSFCTYLEDFLILNQGNLALDFLSVVDSLGFSLMVKTPQFDSRNIRNFTEFTFIADVQKLFVNQMKFSPCLKAKFNIARKTSITASSTFELYPMLASAQKVDLDENCTVEFLFDVFDYKIAVKSKIPLNSHITRKDGVLWTASFGISRS